MWLDVEKGRDTTYSFSVIGRPELWLDVEKGRDTTNAGNLTAIILLWSDVEKGRDTTSIYRHGTSKSCGLM